jgi:very-short-patch-repair endonuclease
MTAPRPTVANARRLRKEMSVPELMLWQAIRREQLDGFKFRRQHPVGPYVLDFFCAAARLCVEVDGQMHHVEDRPERDAARDRWLAKQGIMTLRIPASHVLGSLDGVVAFIRENLPNLPPPGGFAACPPS